MKKTFLAICLSLTTAIAFAQTTAQDWTKTDCDGNSYHLFSCLDNQQVCVLQFDMMNCSSCTYAAGYTDQIYKDYLTSNPGKVLMLSMGYTNSTTCAQMQSWKSSNGFTFPCIEKCPSEVAYYGGMGMPTIVVVANNTHKVYYRKLGFTSSDDAAIRAAINQALADGVSGIEDNVSLENSTQLISVYPNPSQNVSTVSYYLETSSDVTIEVYNILGEKVLAIENEKQPAGEHTAQLNIAGLSDGMYYLRMETGTDSDAIRMIVAH